MKKLLILFLAVFVLASCHKKPAGASDSSFENFVLPSASGPAWNFTEQSKSRPVVIAFMATYCPYCKQMVPYLDNIAKQYQYKNVDVVIALVEDDPEEVKNFIRTQDVRNAKVVYDAGDLAMTLGIRAFPQIFLFDERTDTAGTWPGFDASYADSIRAHLDAVLSAPPAQKASKPLGSV